VLSGIDPGDLVRAIRAQDVARLVRIPGVGKKTAERIGLELKDRLPLASSSAAGLTDAASPGDDLRNDLLSALTNLGYKGPVAEKAVDTALKKTPDAPFEDVLRDILRGMMK
jgi:Holliday junction DNA helicase RuvA